MKTIRYDIQGLRAIAVLYVVIFHAFPSALPGGYIGVDIFFVISGYLITKSIRNDIDAQRFSVAEFYRRRIRRILPALVVALAFCMAAGFWLLSPVDLKSLSMSIAATMLFISNIYFYRTTGYFDGESDFKPLLHTWSLSVEEQFYIIFPIIIAILYKYLQDRYVIILMLISTIILLLISEFILRLSPNAAYFLTPARGFELMMGAVLALSSSAINLPRSQANYISIAGLILIVLPAIFYDQTTSFPGFYAAVPCLGTTLIIMAGLNGPSIVGRFISNPIFVFFGAISYSLYLWHWIFLSYTRIYFGIEAPAEWLAAAVLASIAASAASYRWVETPFTRQDYPEFPYLKLGAATIVAACTISGTVYALQGIPQRFSPRAQELFASRNDFNLRRKQCHNEPNRPIPFSKNCVFGTSSVKPDTVVWGDSHGAEIAVALGERAAKSGRSVMQITSSSCPPSIGVSFANRPDCQQHNVDTLTGIIGNPDLKTVVLASHGGPRRVRMDFIAGYDLAVQKLTEAGKHVLIMLPLPILQFDPPSMLGMSYDKGLPLEAIGEPKSEYDTNYGAIRSALKEISKKYGAKLVDPSFRLCNAEICHAYTEETGPLYFNRNHISVSGARAVVSDIPL